MKPKIDIRYSAFLDPIFKQWVLSKRSDTRFPSPDEVRERVREYRKVWEECGDVILSGIREATGLSFTRNYIPVYVVGRNPRDYSNPLILKSRYTRTQFIETMAHELIHCIFADNTPGIFTDPYPDNPHKIVCAVLAYIYLDVLKNASLLVENKAISRDPEFAESNKEYIEAWKFVEEQDYGNILVRFKSGHS